MIRIVLIFSGSLIPVVMILAGAMMKYYPPKDINHFIGYRTPRSKKSQASWDYAHQVCGALWMKLGFVSLLATIIFITFVENENAIGILVFVQMLPMLGSIVFVEKALKKKFGD